MSYQPPSQPGDESGASSGAYNAPPPGSGYSTPPPPPAGDYTPPAGGGYGSPPGGGYGSSGGAMPPGGGNPSNLAHLPQSYLNAVLKPNVDTYQMELPNASWVKVLIGILIVGLLGFLLSLLGAGAGSAADQFNQNIDQMRAAGQSEASIQIVENIRDFLLPLIPVFTVLSLVGPFLSFFLGAGVQYMAARTIGGAQGGGSFMSHAYLSTLSYVPLTVVMSLLNLLGGIGAGQSALALGGACIVLLIRFYQIFCVGVSMQASQRIEGGRAQMSAWAPVLLFIVLIICFCVVIFVLAAGAANS